jgi:long-chain acyl-CoA synthetase
VIEALYGTRDTIEYETRITYETGATGLLKRHLLIRTVA